MINNDNRTLAVLIDADNARPSIVEGLLAAIAKYGTAIVRRIYGDWTLPNLGGWKATLLQHSIQLFDVEERRTDEGSAKVFFVRNKKRS